MEQNTEKTIAMLTYRVAKLEALLSYTNFETSHWSKGHHDRLTALEAAQANKMIAPKDDITKRILASFAEGLSAREIAERIHADGITTLPFATKMVASLAPEKASETIPVTNDPAPFSVEEKAALYDAKRKRMLADADRPLGFIPLTTFEDVELWVKNPTSKAVRDRLLAKLACDDRATDDPKLRFAANMIPGGTFMGHKVGDPDALKFVIEAYDAGRHPSMRSWRHQAEHDDQAATIEKLERELKDTKSLVQSRVQGWDWDNLDKMMGMVFAPMPGWDDNCGIPHHVRALKADIDALKREREETRERHAAEVHNLKKTIEQHEASNAFLSDCLAKVEKGSEGRAHD